MAVKKKYPQGAPKEHGSGNIYIDAALEALQQAKKEDSSFSYLILLHDNEKHGLELNGDVSTLASTLANIAKNQRAVLKFINIAHYARKMDIIKEERKDILEALDKSERLVEEWIEELKKNKNKSL